MPYRTGVTPLELATCTTSRFNVNVVALKAMKLYMVSRLEVNQHQTIVDQGSMP